MLRLIAGFTKDDIDPPQVFKAWVRVYSPVYDQSAKSWRFHLGEAVVYMDITETDIAEKVLARGGASTADAYHVTLEMSQDRTPSSALTYRYKILELLSFKPGEIGTQMRLDEQES